MDILQTDFLQDAAHRLISGTVKRSIYDGHILLVEDRLAVDDELVEHVGICLIDFLAPVGQKSFCLSIFQGIRMDRSYILDTLDERKDLRCGLRRDLSAVFAIDFVSVILGRVVARRDHDTGKCLVPADRVREHRYRAELIREEYTDTHRGQCTGCDLSKFRREMTGIVRDNDTTLHGIFPFAYDELAKTVGRL